MDELADSRGLASDPVALRARLAADGYVFLRGLLPAERVRAAGEQVAATLRAGGWTEAGSPLLSRAAGPREALAEVPATLGGLAARPGGHRDKPRQPRPLAGTERGWSTTGYSPGDVIIFHCMTPHAALPNTGHRLRLSPRA